MGEGMRNGEREGEARQVKLVIYRCTQSNNIRYWTRSVTTSHEPVEVVSILSEDVN